MQRAGPALGAGLGALPVSGWEVNWSTAMQAHGSSGTLAAGSRISAAVKQASDMITTPDKCRSTALTGQRAGNARPCKERTLQNDGMAHQGVDGQAQHANVDHGTGQTLENRGNRFAAQTAAAFAHDKDGEHVADAAAQRKRDAL